MKKYVLITLFVCISNYCFAQTHEVGFFIGGTNYVGDVGRTNYILPNNPGGSLIYKYNLNPRIALRGSFSVFSIKGDDDFSENAIRNARGYSFKNQVNEVALGLEFNFFEYDLSSKDKTYTPYVLLSLAAFEHDVPRENQPINRYLFTRKTSLAIPVGIGFKTKVYGNIAFAVETSFRYTFTDEIDYPKNSIPDITFDGNGNDWYMFTGISLVYTFGKPSCYAENR